MVTKNNAYKQARPDVLEYRPGQMDAFGIASALMAIHSRRPPKIKGDESDRFADLRSGALAGNPPNQLIG